MKLKQFEQVAKKNQRNMLFTSLSSSSLSPSLTVLWNQAATIFRHLFLLEYTWCLDVDERTKSYTLETLSEKF